MSMCMYTQCDEVGGEVKSPNEELQVIYSCDLKLPRL